MFELSVACKYLLPRRRQLSVSIISLISILVISLVVWLIVVFFSVTDGLEKNWINKLTALTAPVRITPTDAYYNSYYYQIDSISEAAGYSHKTLRDKKTSAFTDPYDSESDEEIPAYWPSPDRDAQGQVKDLVKLAYTAIDEVTGVPDLKAQDFELTASQIRLNLIRNQPSSFASGSGYAQSQLTYPTYLGNFESDNSGLRQTLLPLSMKDLNNLLNLMGTSSTDFSEDEGNEKQVYFPPSILQQRLKDFFQFISVTDLKTASNGWVIPRTLIPTEAVWTVCALFKGDSLLKVMLLADSQNAGAFKRTVEEDPNLNVMIGHVRIHNGVATLEIPSQPPVKLTPRTPLTLIGGVEFPAQLVKTSLDQSKRLQDIQFDIQVVIQGTSIQGRVPYRGLEISTATFDQSFSKEKAHFPLWVYRLNEDVNHFKFILPQDPQVGEGILLPKSFREAGALVGDRGFLTYFSPTASIMQEQQLPVYVAGFYDPGIIPIGGKFILANQDVISIIRATHHHSDDHRMATNGINVRFKNFQSADQVKAQLLQSFKKAGIHRYWNVETYREYEFTKEIMRELQSQKNIFSVIAVVIILVACSNIISMLIILVNDKKVEIGILRSMGASSKSIALIFGLAGGAIGILGSLIGISTAILTIKNLESILAVVSRLQGYDLFNAAFYGETVPQELSFEALSFVLVATVMMSLLAGIVPAVKACLLKPSAILRATG